MKNKLLLSILGLVISGSATWAFPEIKAWGGMPEDFQAIEESEYKENVEIPSYTQSHTISKEDKLRIKLFVASLNDLTTATDITHKKRTRAYKNGWCMDTGYNPKEGLIRCGSDEYEISIHPDTYYMQGMTGGFCKWEDSQWGRILWYKYCEPREEN